MNLDQTIAALMMAADNLIMNSVGPRDKEFLLIIELAEALRRGRIVYSPDNGKEPKS